MPHFLVPHQRLPSPTLLSALSLTAPWGALLPCPRGMVGRVLEEQGPLRRWGTDSRQPPGEPGTRRQPSLLRKAGSIWGRGTEAPWGPRRRCTSSSRTHRAAGKMLPPHLRGSRPPKRLGLETKGPGQFCGKGKTPVPLSGGVQELSGLCSEESLGDNRGFKKSLPFTEVGTGPTSGLRGPGSELNQQGHLPGAAGAWRPEASLAQPGSSLARSEAQGRLSLMKQ